MPQRTRVVILMAATTVFALIVLTVIRVMKPEAFPRYVREFGGLLGLVVWNLRTRRRQTNMTAEPVSGT